MAPWHHRVGSCHNGSIRNGSIEIFFDNFNSSKRSWPPPIPLKYVAADNVIMQSTKFDSSMSLFPLVSILCGMAWRTKQNPVYGFSKIYLDIYSSR